MLNSSEVLKLHKIVTVVKQMNDHEQYKLQNKLVILQLKFHDQLAATTFFFPSFLLAFP